MRFTYCYWQKLTGNCRRTKDTDYNIDRKTEKMVGTCGEMVGVCGKMVGACGKMVRACEKMPGHVENGWACEKMIGVYEKWLGMWKTAGACEKMAGACGKMAGACEKWLGHVLHHDSLVKESNRRSNERKKED